MDNLFMKFVGPAVDGGALTAGHEKDLHLLSWSNGLTLAVTHEQGGKRVEGTVDIHDLNFVFELNSATVPLLKSVFTGANFDKVTLFCYRAAGETETSKQQLFWKIIMDDVICSGVSINGSEGVSKETVNVSLNFAKIQYEYDPQKSDSSAAGKKVISYDIRTQKVA